ncbi:hypothetical protein HU154_01925 [Metamycoplasma hominis]|uniref:hypothetical protein n=1 Tax=Metamycoplasma hominis TaxID=2098 RepID=UPI00158D978C|nr:hypothetical protein [Metamycoplasma hominis]QKX31456.1 hypothetical protein HU152_02045 [Metamycoplasma hominis]QKX37273.1 hypothetical protein HU154_01925 [Metamycoplasma hominis]
MKKNKWKLLTIFGIFALPILPLLVTSCNNRETELKNAETIIGNKEIVFNMVDILNSEEESVLNNDATISGPWRNDFFKIVITSKKNFDKYEKDYCVFGKIDFYAYSILFLIPKKVLLETGFISSEDFNLADFYSEKLNVAFNEQPRKISTNLKNKKIWIYKYMAPVHKLDDKNNKPELRFFYIKQLMLDCSLNKKRLELDVHLWYIQHPKSEYDFKTGPYSKFKLIFEENTK